jgi:hypothetical protein
MESSKNDNLQRRILVAQEKQINELYVLIDTLQTNLRSTVTHIPEEDRSKVTRVRSYKWCINWKPGDEKL